MQNPLEFTIDEYEQSTKEFEKYVKTIPKKVPLKLTKSNTIGSLIKEYHQKSEYSEIDELFMLNDILQTLKNWGKNTRKQCPQSSAEIISLCQKHNKLEKKLEEITQEINSLSELLEFSITEANGFTTEAEVEDVIKVLSLRVNRRDPKSRENEKILLQIQELRETLPNVKKIQKMSDEIERLNMERQMVSERLNQTLKKYEECLSNS